MGDDQALMADLASLVAERVPPTVLAAVVAAQRVVTDHEDMVKLGSDLPAANDRAVAARVVAAYARAGRIEDFVRALIRHDPGNARFVQGVADLLLQKLSSDPDADTEAEKNKQAAIAKRAHMLRSTALLRFMREIEGRICVVGAELKSGGQRQVITGTGFLVGPDLVLTARHVLKDHILGGQPNPAQTGRRCVFFDHLDGDPLGDPLVDPPPLGVRRVDFHPTSWLKSCSDELPKDGLFDPQDAAEIEEAKKRLDFVLIRLAQPVGNHSRRSTGGARRGWIDLWPAAQADRPAARPELLALHDRIIIPQHPNGHPQQIDFGRYMHADPSESRIRYDTETEEGTSGAPCFDQNFNLVGVHNAYFKVHLKPRLNQAIRFDHIKRCLPREDIQPVSAASRLWSVSDDESKPQVILGRGQFQTWIGQASADVPTGLAQRAFVVEGPRPRSGKTFSASILRAARRDLPERIVVLSRDMVPVPKSAADFLRILAGQLRIPDAQLVQMPLRPSDRLPASGDGDKLALWQSKDLPQWFAQALAATRVHSIDVREEAKAVVKLLRSRKIEPTRADLELAALPEPRREDRSLWDRVWIVLDDVSEQVASLEVKDLIASLLGVGAEETAVADELRRLRWVFLGWRPAFLDGIAEVELLDQTTIGNAEIEDCVRALVDSLDQQADASMVEQAITCVEFAKTVPEVRQRFDDPNSRLAMLQSVIGTVRTYFAATPAQPG